MHRCYSTNYSSLQYTQEQLHYLIQVNYSSLQYTQEQLHYLIQVYCSIVFNRNLNHSTYLGIIFVQDFTKIHKVSLSQWVCKYCSRNFTSLTRSSHYKLIYVDQHTQNEYLPNTIGKYDKICPNTVSSIFDIIFSQTWSALELRSHISAKFTFD